MLKNYSQSKRDKSNKEIQDTSISITGESGAGKSTLAMTIAGLEVITKGQNIF